MADTKQADKAQEKKGNVFSNIAGQVREDIGDVVRDVGGIAGDAGRDARHVGGEVVADTEDEAKKAQQEVDDEVKKIQEQLREDFGKAQKAGAGSKITANETPEAYAQRFVTARQPGTVFQGNITDREALGDKSEEK